MKQEERRQKILNILTMVPIATVLELADQLDVTPETIRKDLTELAAAGEIVRIHGGAALAGDTDGSVPYMAREKIRNQEKVDIGRAAAELIDMGDSLILEGSTTVSALCSALAKEKNKFLSYCEYFGDGRTLFQILFPGRPDEQFGTAGQRAYDG